MRQLCPIFDQSYAYLGDIFVSDGKFSNAVLTRKGEERIGEDVQSWRKKGIPVREELFGTEEKQKTIFVGIERVPALDSGFEVALRQWADDRRLLVLSMKPEAVSCWEMLMRLPFEGADLFALALSLSKATRPQLERWDESLRETLAVQEREEAKIKDKLSALRKKVAAKLIKQVK